MTNIIKNTLLKHKLSLLLFIFLNICISTINLISPYLIGKYLDFLTLDISINIIYLFLGIYLSINLTKIIFSYIQNLMGLKIKAKLSFNIIDCFIEHLNKVPIKLLQNFEPVYLSQRISSDSNTITEFLISDIYSIIVSIINFIVISIFLICIEYKIFLILLIAVILYICSYFIFKCKINENSLIFFNAQNLYSSALNEPFKFSKCIKINSFQNIFKLRMSNNFKSFLESLNNYGKVTYLYNGLKDVIEVTFTIFILLICGLSVIDKTMTIGQVTAILNYFLILLSSLGYILTFGKNYEEFKVCFSRLEELLEIEKEQNGNVKLDKVNKIRLENIVYSDSNNIVIDNFNYIFNKGNIYTLIGENGCGKSTLLYIISKIINNTSGDIYFNEINYKKIDMNYLRKNNISFLEQEPILVKDTFYNNIMYNIESNELLDYYIDLFDLEKCFIKFKEGIHTDISENLENISGGEKQKIGLVKTLIKNPDVLILDEPTSALDTISSNRLKEYLNCIKEDKIIIIVTHSDTMSDISDFIIKLDKDGFS